MSGKNKYKFFLIFVLVSAIFLALGPHLVCAQTTGDPVAEGLDAFGEETVLGDADPRLIVARILRIAFGFLGVVTLVVILYGGFLYMTSGGAEEKTKKARQWIVNGIIGLAIMLSAFSLTSFIMNKLGEATGANVGTGNNGTSGNYDPVTSGAYRVGLSPQGDDTPITAIAKVIFPVSKLPNASDDYKNAKDNIKLYKLGEKTELGCVAASPVAQWRFDESSGSTASAVANASATGVTTGTKWVAGKYNQALDFEGTGNVEIPKVINVNGATEMTVEAWIKGNQYVDGQSLVSSYLSDSEQQFVFGRMTSGDTTGGKIGNLTFSVTDEQSDSVTTTTVIDSEWHHVAAVFKGGQYLKIYIDGTEAASKNTTVAKLTSLDAPITIGGYAGHSFNGLMDEVVLYSYALTTDEVKARYECNPITSATTAFDTEIAVAGTYLVGGNVIKFIPETGCPQGCIKEHCLEPNTSYRLKVGQLTDADNNSVACPYLASGYCEKTEFKTNDQCDATGPEISFNIVNPPIQQDTSVSADATISDDGGLSTVQFCPSTSAPADLCSEIQTMVGHKNFTTSFTASVRGLSLGMAKAIMNATDVSDNATNKLANYLIASANCFHEDGSFDCTLPECEVPESQCNCDDPTRCAVFACTETEKCTTDCFQGFVDEVGAPCDSVHMVESCHFYRAASYWNMDFDSGNQVLDQIGNFDGTITDAEIVDVPKSSGDPMAFKRALKFDSNSKGRVSFGDVHDVAFNDFTVTAWAQANSFVEAGAIVSKGAYFNQNGPGYFIGFPSQPHDIFFGVNDGTQFYEIRSNVLTDAEIATGEEGFGWTHFALVKKGSEIHAYINGSLVGTKTGVNASLSNASPFFIGHNGVRDASFNGLIDDVAFYNRALTATEIQGIFGCDSGATVTACNDRSNVTTCPARAQVVTTCDLNCTGWPYPVITRIDPLSGPVDSFITIKGQNFGDFGAKSKVYINNIEAPPACNGADSWSNSEVVVRVPSTTTGSVKLVNYKGEYNDTGDSASPGYKGPFTVTPGMGDWIGLCSVKNSVSGKALGEVGSFAIATGYNFGDAQESSRVLFNGYEVSPGTWGRESISSIRVPNVQDGFATVQISRNSIVSNPKTFTVVAPKLQLKISGVANNPAPSNQLITISGSNFGQSGTVDFIKGEKVTPALMACANAWSPDQIVVQVPKLDSGEYTIKVTGPTGFDSISFVVDNSLSVAPGICEVTPDNGPSGTKFLIAGFGFGDDKGKLSVKFFKGKDSSGENVYVVSSGADLQNSSIGEKTISGYKLETISNLYVPALSKSGEMYVERDGVASNKINFKVGACTANSCDEGEVCCQNAYCLAETACQSQKTKCEYGWYFSTGVIPKIPGIIERSCDLGGYNESPSPFKNLQTACPNGLIGFTFNMKMDLASFSAEGAGGEKRVSIRKCKTPGAVCNLDVCASSDCQIDEYSFNLIPLEDTYTYKELSDSNYGGHEVTEVQLKNYSLVPDTWYQVVVRRGLLNDPDDGSTPVEMPNDYTWNFHTSEANCSLEKVVVNPSDGVIQDVDENQKYVVNGQADNCAILDMSQYSWLWDLKNYKDRLKKSDYRNLPSDMVFYELMNADVQETPEEDPAIVNAKTTVENREFDDNATLAIKFRDPRVVSYWPNCDEACINAGFGAIFNTKMKYSYLTTPSLAYVRLYKCSDQYCSTVKPDQMVNYNNWNKLTLTCLNNKGGSSVKGCNELNGGLTPNNVLEPGTYYRIALMKYLPSISNKTLTGLNFNTANSDAQCGNGKIESGEECEAYCLTADGVVCRAPSSTCTCSMANNPYCDSQSCKIKKFPRCTQEQLTAIGQLLPGQTKPICCGDGTVDNHAIRQNYSLSTVSEQCEADCNKAGTTIVYGDSNINLYSCPTQCAYGDYNNTGTYLGGMNRACCEAVPGCQWSANKCVSTINDQVGGPATGCSDFSATVLTNSFTYVNGVITPFSTQLNASKTTQTYRNARRLSCTGACIYTQNAVGNDTCTIDTTLKVTGTVAERCSAYIQLNKDKVLSASCSCGTQSIEQCDPAHVGCQKYCAEKPTEKCTVSTPGCTCGAVKVCSEDKTRICGQSEPACTCEITDKYCRLDNDVIGEACTDASPCTCEEAGTYQFAPDVKCFNDSTETVERSCKQPDGSIGNACTETSPNCTCVVSGRYENAPTEKCFEDDAVKGKCVKAKGACIKTKHCVENTTKTCTESSGACTCVTATTDECRTVNQATCAESCSVPTKVGCVAGTPGCVCSLPGGCSNCVVVKPEEESSIFDSFSWVFKTRDSGDFCRPEKVLVKPVVRNVVVPNTEIDYMASPLTAPDKCSAQGQLLNSYNYDWTWSGASGEADKFEVSGMPFYPGVKKLVHLMTSRFGASTPEQCDGSTCLLKGSRPIATICGNGILEPGEECEFTNNAGTISDNPNCSDRCLNLGTTSAFGYSSGCGNGSVETGEECDDKNFMSDDGCSDSCIREGSTAAGFVCGNGKLETGEDEDFGSAMLNKKYHLTTECLNAGSVYTLNEVYTAKNSITVSERVLASGDALCGDGKPQASEKCEPVAANCKKMVRTSAEEVSEVTCTAGTDGCLCDYSEDEYCDTNCLFRAFPECTSSNTDACCGNGKVDTYAVGSKFYTEDCDGGVSGSGCSQAVQELCTSGENCSCDPQGIEICTIDGSATGALCKKGDDSCVCHSPASSSIVTKCQNADGNNCSLSEEGCNCSDVTCFDGDSKVCPTVYVNSVDGEICTYGDKCTSYPQAGNLYCTTTGDLGGKLCLSGQGNCTCFNAPNGSCWKGATPVCQTTCYNNAAPVCPQLYLDKNSKICNPKNAKAADDCTVMSATVDQYCTLTGDESGAFCKAGMTGCSCFIPNVCYNNVKKSCPEVCTQNAKRTCTVGQVGCVCEATEGCVGCVNQGANIRVGAVCGNGEVETGEDSVCEVAGSETYGAPYSLATVIGYGLVDNQETVHPTASIDSVSFVETKLFGTAPSGRIISGNGVLTYIYAGLGIPRAGCDLNNPPRIESTTPIVGQDLCLNGELRFNFDSHVASLHQSQSSQFVISNDITNKVEVSYDCSEKVSGLLPRAISLATRVINWVTGHEVFAADYCPENNFMATAMTEDNSKTGKTIIAVTPTDGWRKLTTYKIKIKNISNDCGGIIPAVEFSFDTAGKVCKFDYIDVVPADKLVTDREDVWGVSHFAKSGSQFIVPTTRYSWVWHGLDGEEWTLDEGGLNVVDLETRGGADVCGEYPSRVLSIADQTVNYPPDRDLDVVLAVGGQSFPIKLSSLVYDTDEAGTGTYTLKYRYADTDYYISSKCPSGGACVPDDTQFIYVNEIRSHVRLSFDSYNPSTQRISLKVERYSEPGVINATQDNPIQFATSVIKESYNFVDCNCVEGKCALSNRACDASSNATFSLDIIGRTTLDGTNALAFTTTDGLTHIVKQSTNNEYKQDFLVPVKDTTGAVSDRLMRFTLTGFNESAGTASLDIKVIYDSPSCASGGNTVTTATPGGDNGLATIVSRAVIMTDREFGEVGAERSGSGTVDVFLCENPWTYIDESYNVQLRYCRDSGESNRTDDDLPYLNAIGASIPDKEQEILLKQVFMVRADDPAVSGLDPTNDQSPDAIALRVYANPNNFSAREWYRRYVPNPSASLSDIELDCRTDENAIKNCAYGVRDGNTIYVSGGNLRGNTLYNNIYVIGYTQGAGGNTNNIMNQMVQGQFRLNINVNSSYTLYAVKRDIVRINDVNYITELLRDYYDRNLSLPALASGTYERNMVISSWPSWKDQFAGTLRTALPVDPINKFEQYTPSSLNDGFLCPNNSTNSTGRKCRVDNVDNYDACFLSDNNEALCSICSVGNLFEDNFATDTDVATCYNSAYTRLMVDSATYADSASYLYGYLFNSYNLATIVYKLEGPQNGLYQVNNPPANTLTP